MAALTFDQYKEVFTEGSCMRTSMFALKNVDAGDTMDLGGYFKVVKRGGIISATGSTIAAVTIGGNNTTITVPVGPLDDGLWLLVVGVSI